MFRMSGTNLLLVSLLVSLVKNIPIIASKIFFKKSEKGNSGNNPYTNCLLRAIPANIDLRYV